MRQTNSNRSKKSSSGKMHALLIINLLALIILVVAFGYFFFEVFQEPDSTIVTEPVVGMGNTSGNISNYGYVVSDEEYVYLANYNRIGTIVKRDLRGNEEEIVNLNTDSINICGLNIYNGTLYFIIANTAGQQSVYAKDLSNSDPPRSVAMINRPGKNYLVSFILNGSIYVFAADTINFSSGINSELIRYDLSGNQIANTTVAVDRITCDGTNLYGLSYGNIIQINPEDLSSNVLFTLPEYDHPVGSEFFAYEDHLYFPTLSDTSNRLNISTIAVDGSDYHSILEKRINDFDPEEIALNVNGGYLFIFYGNPNDTEYSFTQFNLENETEVNILSSEDNFPNVDVSPETPVLSTYLYTTKTGVYYLRTYDTTREGFGFGVYNYISYGTAEPSAVGNFLYKTDNTANSTYTEGEQTIQ